MIVGRTEPFSRIHPKGPTASLVSKKVLASIIGQIIIASAFQFWAFFWIRAQPWYVCDAFTSVSLLILFVFEGTHHRLQKWGRQT